MPPSRDPVWDHFYSLKSDFKEPAIQLELQARKNASYDNAWCKSCVDQLLGQVEYSHWVPVGQCTQEYLDILRRYRVMKVVPPIRGQPKNLERHLRQCKYVPDSIRPKPLDKPPKETKPKLPLAPTTLADALPHPLTSSAPMAGMFGANPHTPQGQGHMPIDPALAQLPTPLQAPLHTPVHGQGQGQAQGQGVTPTPPRLSRQKQAELDADIYNLFTGLGIPFDDRTCMIYGQFVRKWIPGAKWGED